MMLALALRGLACVLNAIAQSEVGVNTIALEMHFFKFLILLFSNTSTAGSAIEILACDGQTETNSNPIIITYPTYRAKCICMLLGTPDFRDRELRPTTISEKEATNKSWEKISLWFFFPSVDPFGGYFSSC